jgi:Ca-activated chloride channel family protein
LLLLYLYGMHRRRKFLDRFASARGLQAIVPGTGHRRRWTKAGLVLFSALLAIVALAGPKYGYRWQEIEQKGIDIIVALDCSKSMLATDIEPSRLDRAKREVYDLLTMLQGDRVGLVAFAGTAFLQCPLTIDYDAFHIFLKALTPDFLPVGGTDLTAALLTGLASFDTNATAEKAIILITDGENTGSGNPLEAAGKAREQGVKLFCIGVGKSDGVPLPEPEGGFKKDPTGKIVLSSLDEETLKKMAVMTGGTYARSVAGDMDLDAIYIEQIRGKMEAATVTGGRKQVFEDRYQWPLAAAVILLIIELFIATVPSRALAAVIVLLAMGLAPPVQAGALQEGLSAYEKGDYEKALKLLIDAQLKDPDQPAILYNIGNAFYKTGDFESADHYFNQALNSDVESLKHKAHYNLGNTSFRKGALEEAIQHYEAALKIDPTDEQARQNIAFVKQVMQQQQAQKGQPDGDSQKEQQNQESAETQEQPSRSSAEQKSSPAQQSDSQTNDQEDRQTPAPQYGEQMNQEDAAAPQGAGQPEESQKDRTAATGETPQPATPSENDRQAQRMLNRLEDQPGRAAIPFYQKREVEKDW